MGAARSLLALTLLGAALFPPLGAWAQEVEARSTEELVRAALADAEAGWSARDQEGVSQRVIEGLSRARALASEDFELRWQLARYCYWEAISSPDDEGRAGWGKKGWDEAEVAKRIRPEAVAGYYWAAANIGAYSEGAGLMDAVKQGLADHFKANVQRAIGLDPRHDNGGPYRAMGRYYYKVPWPISDLERAEDYLKKAIGVAPSAAINLYYMAEVQVENGRPNEARRLCQQILALDPNTGDSAGTRRYQAQARALLETL